MKRVILSIFLLLSSELFAKGREQSSIHLFGAVGTLFAPASIRIGGKSFEIGLLNQRSFGITAITPSKNGIFSEFGIALMSPANPALFAGMGYEFWDYGWINGRVEGNGTVSAKNQTHGEILLGVNINF